MKVPNLYTLKKIYYGNFLDKNVFEVLQVDRSTRFDSVRWFKTQMFYILKGEVSVKNCFSQCLGILLMPLQTVPSKY